MATYGGTSKQPTKDNSIRSDQTTYNHGGSAYIVVATQIWRALLEFNISDFAALIDGGTINTAYVYLYYLDHWLLSSAVGRTYNVDRVRRSDLEEGTAEGAAGYANWSYYKTSASYPWETAGCAGTSLDIDTTQRSQKVLPGAEGAWVTFDVKAILQEAIANSRAYLGLRIQDNSESGSYCGRFYSKENATLKPYLLVDYTPLVGPTVLSSDATNLTGTAATLNGSCTVARDTNIVERGFVWGTSDGGDLGDTEPGAPWDYHNHDTDGQPWTPTFNFSHGITGLSPNILYYFRAWCKNSAGKYGYSPVKTFEADLPTISSSAATNVTKTAARVNGNLTDDGGLTTDVKLYYGESDGGQTPGSWDHCVDLGNKSIGTFYHDLSNLPCATKHYFIFSATNSYGTSWSAAGQYFTTLPPTYIISGHVYYGANPIEGVTVLMYNTDTGDSVILTTDASGYYENVDIDDAEPVWAVDFLFDIKATLTTNLGVGNADLVYTALDPNYPGMYGNAISVKYLNNGANKSLSVSVVSKCIIVQLETDGSSVIQSTASEVLAAVNAHTTANTMVLVTNKAGNDGSGVVTAMAETLLNNGESFQDYDWPETKPAPFGS